LLPYFGKKHCGYPNSTTSYASIKHQLKSPREHVPVNHTHQSRTPKLIISKAQWMSRVERLLTLYILAQPGVIRHPCKKTYGFPIRWSSQGDVALKLSKSFSPVKRQNTTTVLKRYILFWLLYS